MNVLAPLQTLTLHARLVKPGDIVTVTDGAFSLRGRFRVKRVTHYRDGRVMITYEQFSISGLPFSGRRMIAANVTITIDRL